MLNTLAIRAKSSRAKMNSPDGHAGAPCYTPLWWRISGSVLYVGYLLSMHVLARDERRLGVRTGALGARERICRVHK